MPRNETTYQNRAAVALLAIAISAIVAACGGADGQSDRIRVATTLYPIEYFTQRIGGDRIEVVNLIPPGVEAHDFEPSVSDLTTITGADLLVYNGAGFEPWVERTLSALGSDAPTAVEMTNLFTEQLLISETEAHEDEEHVEEAEGQSELDPHVWLSPVLASRQAQAVANALIGLDPDSEDFYSENRDRLLPELAGLDSAFRSRLASCAKDLFVTSHTAFAYLAREYGLRQIGVSGISPDAEPGPQTLASIATEMKELGVRYVLVEPITSTRVAETLAREVGATTLPLHPLETLTVDEESSGADYFTVMRSNLESLATALECGA